MHGFKSSIVVLFLFLVYVFYYFSNCLIFMYELLFLQDAVYIVRVLIDYKDIPSHIVISNYD